MTLGDMINDTLTSISSTFAVKHDYTSILLSDAWLIYITTAYYKVQYLVDSTIVVLSTLFVALTSSISTTSFNALTIALKFLLLIALLIFIRGGIPRYRFDHLTKVGGIKYLSLVLASMLIQFLLLGMC